MNEAYKKQVELMLSVLPEVAKEQCFAMHGGTAINLFVRDMPRLSVDIDLTYVEIDSRESTLLAINEGLASIKNRIEHVRSATRIHHKKDTCKPLINDNEAVIKIEVNMVARDLIAEPQIISLCKAAQEDFDASCTMTLVSQGQLYGGKLCAALDRQHPRDLFDVKGLFDNEGLNDEIKQGLIYGLLCANRPTYEMLDPNLLDQRSAFENQFKGMSRQAFTYDEFEQVRCRLIESVRKALGAQDKAFLLSCHRLEPDWSIYDYQAFPAVKWKLINLERFRREKPGSYQEQIGLLEKLFET